MPDPTVSPMSSSLEKMALLNEIGGVALSADDLEALFQDLPGLLRARCGLQHVMIGTVDYDKGELCIQGTAGIDPVLIEQQRCLDIKQGIIGEAMESGRSVVINDVAESPRYVRLIPSTRSEMCIPLRETDQVVGFLNIESDRIGAFEQVDIEFFEAVGSFLGQAIRNARLREELQHSRNYMESVIQNAGDAIVTFDRTGRILTWNRAAERILGQPSAAVMCRNVVDLIPDARETMQGLRLRVLAGEIIDGFHMKSLDANGSAHVLELSMAPVRGQDEEVTGVSCIVRDISEKMAAKKQLERNLQVMRLLIEIAKEMTSILELDELMRRIGALLRRVIEYEILGIFLYNSDSGALELKVSIGYDPEMISRHAILPLGSGVLGRACLERRTISSTHLSQDPEAIEGKSVDGRRTESEVAIPIISHDRLLGGLVIESCNPDHFKPEHVEILEALARHLAVSIDNARLFDDVRAKEQRLQANFELARDLQLNMLPVGSPSIEHFEVEAFYQPAESLGGDYYDFIWLNQNVLGIAIGDVSGKGVAAAMTMAAARSAIRFAARLHPSPSQVLYHANRRLHRDIKQRTYVTLFYATLDVEARLLKWSNAGHFYPLLVKARGNTEKLSRGGLPLALFDRSRYASSRTSLSAGDIVCFYTDGVVEATSGEGEEFGTDRLEAAVRRAAAGPANAILRSILKELKEFSAGARSKDDVTLMILKTKGDR